MPEVSIIVPIYKAENVLEGCIESILAQTFADFELILVDDGSPDRSGFICDSYVQQDERIRVIHQSNSGVSAARNTGLRAATGEYVLFVDSDDYIDASFVAELHAHKSDLTCCGMIVQDERGQELYSIKHVFKQYSDKATIDYAKLYKSNLLYSPCCRLLKNSIIQENHLQFPEKVTWGEDGMFVADYLQYVQSVTVLENTGYHYVKYDSADSLSTKVREDVIEMIGLSRQYCIDKMKVTSPEAYEAVREVCLADMKKNSTFFVRKLIENTELNRGKKVKVLQRYMQSEYVMDTFQNANIFYAGRELYQTALAKKSASGIIRTYFFEVRKREIWEWLCRLYNEQPEFVKKIYRSVKKWVKR